METVWLQQGSYSSSKIHLGLVSRWRRSHDQDGSRCTITRAVMLFHLQAKCRIILRVHCVSFSDVLHDIVSTRTWRGTKSSYPGACKRQMKLPCNARGLSQLVIAKAVSLQTSVHPSVRPYVCLYVRPAIRSRQASFCRAVKARAQ